MPVQKPTDPVAVWAPDFKLTTGWRASDYRPATRSAWKISSRGQIEAVCFRCNRTRELTLARLKRGRLPRDRLIDVETKRRCTNCRRGGDHVLNVTVASRD